ncbi:MAG: hypothetical protein CVU54_01850 [Deltaproteobacteria bacterium HGW-Deltaproteobacteria-12]|jgi:hypothetical protein|nr:MAG: hypothetical protein CVU54_01850 [Deltaproteobacteria bacterium HGW-Deltaproteobacteria-12]
MTITALPPAPSRSNPSTFSALADAFIAALSTFVSEVNATAAAMDLNDTTSTSTTSLAIGTGSKSLTVDASKSYQVGMSVKIAHDSSNWMFGEVTSYNSGTGALVVNVTLIAGSGTEASWTVTLSGPVLMAAAQILALINPTASRIIGKKATGASGELTGAEVAVLLGGTASRFLAQGASGDMGLKDAAAARTILGLSTSDAVVFGSLNTASGDTGSIAHNTPTTIITASGNSMYIVFAYIAAAGSANYTAYAFVLTEGSDARIAAGNGSLLTLTISGLNIRVTQNSGGAATVAWKAVKIA